MKDANRASFVLDASVAACWAFDDEQHPVADIAFTSIRTQDALVPSLWWFEVRNILIVNERRKRISESDTTIFLRELSRLRIREDGEHQETTVLRIARTHRLTVYDAAYLELALREDVPLATLDNELSSTARLEGAKLMSVAS
jgi:predicted nucleic acid-binding protein